MGKGHPGRRFPGRLVQGWFILTPPAHSPTKRDGSRRAEGCPRTFDELNQPRNTLGAAQPPQARCHRAWYSPSIQWPATL